MNKIDYIEINRQMWQLTADIYQTHGFEEALENVQQPDFTTWDDVEEDIFAHKIDIKGKNIIQIGCNDGTEIINLKKQGANLCFGIDISDKFIAQAKQLSQASGHIVDFEVTDIYNIDESHFDKYDLIYITVGVLGWMPDIFVFFQIVQKLLKTTGQCFVYEQHPILGMFNPEPPHKVDSSYFRKEPFKDDIIPEYIDRAGKLKAISYWFPHTISDILNACFANQLKIIYFQEYAKEISETYKSLQDNKVLFPLSFALIANKE